MKHFKVAKENSKMSCSCRVVVFAGLVVVMHTIFSLEDTCKELGETLIVAFCNS